MSADSLSESFDADLDGFPVAVNREGNGSALTLETLADRFAAETRGGLSPTIEGYARRYPAFADDIREVFPALIALEHWKLDKEAECLRRNVPREFPLHQLGEYRLLREIGRGGMGVVFEAAQGPSKRRVAVKVLPWRYGASVPRWRKRFEAEVRTISQLKHPNIVEIYGFGEQEGYCYFVMQLVEGVSLDRLINRFEDVDELCLDEELRLSRQSLDDDEPFPDVNSQDDPPPQRLRRNSWREFARMMYQAARAVDFAHREGVLHNDVKPGNVLVDSLGRVRVGDFGLAKNLEAETGEPTDELAGTLRYMAPERFSGASDARTDVYSLGVTTYELITHSPLYSPSDRGPLLAEIEKGAFHPPRRLNPEIPPALEAIVLKALEYAPGDRYQTAHAMAADLLRFANGRSIGAKRIGPIRRLLRSWGRLMRRSNG